MITTTAGNPYGHVPGHTYVDATVRVWRSGRASITIAWGSAQGLCCDEEHGRREYARDSLSAARDAACAEEEDDDTRAYIETACAKAARRVVRRRDPRRPEIDEDRAASLITAAPELLAACEGLLDAAAALSDHARAEFGGPGDAAVTAALGAIAAARGEKKAPRIGG